MLLPYGIEGSMKRLPRATYLLIALNTIFFLITLFIGEDRRNIIFMQWGFIPEEWFRILPLFTSMFLHGGILHIISNMYFLWIFGQILEDTLGIKKYIYLYLGTGVVGSIAHSLTIGPFFADLPCIGASGAISGILGAFIILNPHARVKMFYFFLMLVTPIFGTFEISALIFISSWFLMQLLYTTSLSGSVGVVPVAYWAHIGGFLFGMFAASAPKLYSQGHSLFTGWIRHREFVRAVRLAQDENLPEAAEMLEDLKTTGSETGNPDILLSQTYFQMGDTENAKVLAATAFSSALVLKDKAQTITAYYILKNAGGAEKLKAHDYLLLGRSFAKYRKTRQAAGILTEALKKFPGDDETDLILYELGDLCFRTGNHERAEEFYTTLLESCPDSKLYKSAEYCLQEIHTTQPAQIICDEQ